jgi:hypothetical protein
VDGESEKKKKKHQDFERVSGALMRGGLKRIRPIEIVFFCFSLRLRDFLILGGGRKCETLLWTFFSGVDTRGCVRVRRID